LSDSNENPGFNEKSNQSGLTPPAYFAQIVDIHPKGNYSYELPYLRIDATQRRSDTRSGVEALPVWPIG
jgi:hypothetical protein